MAFSNIETGNHTWLALQWPEHLHFRHVLGIPSEEEPVKVWEVVPRTSQGLRSWAFVGPNPTVTDNTRTLQLLYKSPPLLPHAPVGTMFQVGVRVQGFVQSCNLNPLGNWSRDMAPPAATQFLLLSGGSTHGHVFSQYKTAVSEVVGYIYRSLHVNKPPETERDSRTMKHRVDASQITGRNRHQPSVLDTCDDPWGDTASVQDDWRVTTSPNVGMYIRNDSAEEPGDLVALDAHHIGEGDFVDVCVGFDIVHRPGKGRNSVPEVRVHLTIEHILLLCAATAAVPMAVDNVEYNVLAPGLKF
ncbi:hypothetical protein K438DRAFT_1748313 [Mycena galopus ATCC 62051]|nr:hypothetical protein K438DRAFT_1748313 [Mycena galopus ATCC 62051]